MIVDIWLQACVFNIASTYAQLHEKHAKMARSDEIDLDKELEVFLLEGSNSDVQYGST